MITHDNLLDAKREGPLFSSTMRMTAYRNPFQRKNGVRIYGG